METANHRAGNFPRPGVFSLYVFAVVVMCFFNWVILNAQPTSKANNLDSQLVIALTDEEEPDIQLRDWMMDFNKEFLAVNEEPELCVEPWMLSFSLDYMTRTEESEIIFEPWMINFEKRCLVIEDERDVPVECWMVCTYTWECAGRLLARW